MKARIALFIAAAAAFGLAPSANQLGPVVGACLLVLLGIALALAASGTISAIGAASGAVGAFAGGVLLDSSAALAGAVLVGLAYAERTLRVRSGSARAVHVAMAMMVGALAGAITERYLGTGITLRVVVVMVSAVLVSLPLLVEADDPLAHALDGIADEVSDPAKSSLTEGAELCRTVDSSMLERKTALEAEKTWRTLLRLGQARVRLERAQKSASHGEAVVRRIDERINDHVKALARMYTAADHARAAEMSLDDSALRSVEDTGESLTQVSQAIVDEV